MNSEEKGVPIRVPATANLMIASEDRVIGTSVDFNISRNESIMNGFFNRIGTTEVVLNWNVPNVSAATGNNTFSVTIGGTPFNVVVPDGNYDVYSLLIMLAGLLEDAPGMAPRVWAAVAPFAVANATGIAYLGCSVAYTLVQTRLSTQLGMTPGLSPAQGTDFGIQVINPDLRNYRYLDFVSDNLTYNQDVKDNSTNVLQRNVLCRWYFADQVTNDVDIFGYPIFQQYTQFSERRIFSPPKQIRWNPTQPIGQMRFQLYLDSSPTPATQIAPFVEWYMTLQVSEN